jgi:hypothetical protein
MDIYMNKENKEEIIDEMLIEMNLGTLIKNILEDLKNNNEGNLKMKIGNFLYINTKKRSMEMSTQNVFKKLKEAAKRLLAKKKSMDKSLYDYPDLINDLDKYYFIPRGLDKESMIENLNGRINLRIGAQKKPLGIESLKGFVNFLKERIISLRPITGNNDYIVYVDNDGHITCNNNVYEFAFRNDGSVSFRINKNGDTETIIVGNLDDLRVEYDNAMKGE